MVPANSHRISRVPRYSGAGWLRSGDFAYGALTLYGRAFQRVPLSPRRSPSPVLLPRAAPSDARGLGSSAFARHYLRHHSYFLLLRVLRCFSSPRSPQPSAGDGIAPAGFPHSDIRESRRICHSSRLFAACHVLLRLRGPQASPVRPFLLSFFFRLFLAFALGFPRSRVLAVRSIALVL